VPYLAVPDELVERWGKRLYEIQAFKVGIAWAGSATLEADSKRSIPLSILGPLFDIPGISIISLQKPKQPLEAGRGDVRFLDWMEDCNDFMDTAALVANLDLVISVDTAVAHLAGALARRTWLLNRLESEWRWGLESDRSPWYPTMQIFRQREANRWDGTVERVAAELRHLVRTAGLGGTQ
jgi:hypothetical protein